MCASEYVVDIFSGLYSDREPFWLENSGLGVQDFECRPPY